MHETTQLCIRQIRKYLKDGDRILDVGTGSGILSIAALKLGAGYALGTDLDPCAVTAVKENMEVNGLKEDQYDVILGNIIDDPKVLTPVVIHQLKKGGIYITSGIIDDKETVVVEAVKAAGLEVLEVTHQGEWVSVTARKN